MSSEYSKVGLYNHNIESYKKVSQALKNDDVAAIVHATGTGKTYNALQLACDNKDKKIIYVVPSNGIIDHIKNLIENNPNLDYERDFPNLEFRTYQSFINMSKEEINSIEVDMLILDEFHHIGAPIWGQRINTIINTHPNLKVFGMTAYTVRDRGTQFERDMTNPETNELFSNKVVSRYDLCDAIIDGVLPKPIYKSAYINLIGTERILEEKVRSLNTNSKEYTEYMRILSDVKKKIHEAPSISDVVKRNIKPNGKYIYFCPPNSLEGTNDILTIQVEAKKWFLDMGLREEDIVFYTTTNEMGDFGKYNRNAFYNDINLYGEDVNKKLRVMFAINQYNEGIHAPNVDGVIMGRGTSSDIIYFEQLGRALSVRGNTKEKYEEYEKYSLDELIELCKKRDIKIEENLPKEEIIEKLIAPLVIDLTANSDFIRELEDNLKERVKEVIIENSIEKEKREIKIRDASFDIEILNEDIFELLKYVSDKLINVWDKMYEYAKIYYEHHHNLAVPQKFKTNNGYEYDKNGQINLGFWVSRQRRSISPESERGKLLTQIGMVWDVFDFQWQKNYELAKLYYEHHGDLNIPHGFKTNNGYEYDENGKVNLGIWIISKRKDIKPESERGKLLTQIGMVWDILEMQWQKNYELAKLYYEHHHNLEIPSKFKTNNGYEHDENGKVNLGIWIRTQRNDIKPESKKGQLLYQIGMVWNVLEMQWQKNYELAKLYYEHHHNLEIPSKFKTNNGYEHDENGKVNLGTWINAQRQKTSPESERGKLLTQIGMVWDKVLDFQWQKNYELAKRYYEHHHNLEIPSKFKTNNGYEHDENGKFNLGDWISGQRKSTSPESERGKLLTQIGMIWDVFEEQWQKNYELAKIYYEHHHNLLVPNKFKTNNGYEYDENGKVNLGFWIITQRNDIKPESEREKLLTRIGMVWDKVLDFQWQKNYELAKIYYEHHHNLLVPNRFKTNNGYEYDKNGKFNLGFWINTQKLNTNPESERGKLLTQIGMVWDKVLDFQWQKNYELAKIYYEHHHNLLIPKGFKTNNGYEYDENGKFNLGVWISTQRASTNTESERGKLLTQIGMVWNVKKNDEQIKRICEEYNITVNINKVILKHISIQELISKIRYLNELNIPIVNEKGKLHEIFSISNIDLLQKYKVSLEDLVTKYYIPLEEKKVL